MARRRVTSSELAKRRRLQQQVAEQRSKLNAPVPRAAMPRVRASRRPTSKLEVQVARERAKIKAGTSTLTGDTGDILKGSKVDKKDERRAKLAGAKLSAAGVSPDKGVLDKVVGAASEAVKFQHRALKDIATLPITVAQGTYENFAAIKEMAEGNPDRARRIYEGFRDNDPFALAAQGRFKESGKSISDHPGLFAVEAAGLKSTAGRGVTKAQEKAGKTPTKREPARDPATGFEVKRQYSRDIVTRQVQKHGVPGLRNRPDSPAVFKGDKRAVAHAEAMRVKADSMEKSGSTSGAINELRHAANVTDPRVTNPKQAKVAAARAADVSKIIAEKNEGKVDSAVQTALNAGGEKPTAAVVLAAQRITDGTPESLAAYRSKLQQAAESGKLSDAELAANRKARSEIDKALAAKHDPANVKTAAKAVEDVLRPMQQRLVDEGILPAARARKAPLVGYAVTQMSGVRPGTKGPMRDVPGRVRGKKVKAKEIEGHMAARGVTPGVFISQRPAKVAGGAGGGASGTRVVGQARTGSATVRGTADIHPDIVRRTARTQQRLLDHADTYRAKLRQFGADKNMTRREAVQYASDMQARHGQEYVAVPRYPFAGDKDIARMVREGTDPDLFASQQSINNVIDRALSGAGPPKGDYTIMSKAAADELRALSANELQTGTLQTTAKAISVNFRRNVLSTSPSWIVGNAVEGQIRSMFAGVRPGDSRFFKRIVEDVRKVDARLADELETYGAGAGHHGSTGRLEHGQFLSQYESSSVKPIANALARVWEKPTPARVAKAWNAYTDFMFKSVSGRLESNFQSSMSGAIIRRSDLIPPGMGKHSQAAVEQAARGLINTPEQAALGKSLADAFGRYSGRTSDAKWAITTYTPFANWMLSAAEFVFRVLPRDHPAITSLTVAMDNATSSFYDNGALPGWLRGSVDIGGGTKLRISRYMPFGAFSSVENIPNLVIPQFASSLAALKGMDWKGKKLRDKDGTEVGDDQRALLAAQAFLEGTVPFMSKIKQAATKGPMSIPIGTAGYVKSKPPKSKGRAPSSGGNGLILDGGAGLGDLIIEGSGSESGLILGDG